LTAELSGKIVAFLKRAYRYDLLKIFGL